MFVDARDIDERDTLEADICVVGTGAAGIPLALTLARTPTQVVVLESGGLTADRDDSPIYRVVDDLSPLVNDPSRRWFFGGNTNHWFGNCRPLDDADFTPRAWIAHSGWPIRHEQLLPYYAQAQDLCGLGTDDDEGRAHLAQTIVDVDPGKLIRKIMRTCPVLSFGQLYRQRIEDAPNLRICLHARALRLETNARGDIVRAVQASARNGRRFRVVARAFVLAAGGIENPRLLLCSNDVQPNGLGNANDLVGRFFMEHPYVDLPLGRRGHDRAALQSVYRDRTPIGMVSAGWQQWALSDELMRTERVTGMSIWVRRPPPPWDALRAKVAGLLHGRSRIGMASPSGGRMLNEGGEVGHFIWRTLGRDRRLSVGMEQSPDPDNRIRVSAERDRFGQPNVTLSFRITEEDRQRHGRALRIAAATLGLDGRHFESQLYRSFSDGRLDFFWHHMGTTRMHADPQQGVVDSDCRVHGVPNLFIAGSSVFPTGGTAPPTLTIVALSLRLAEHLLQSLT